MSRTTKLWLLVMTTSLTCGCLRDPYIHKPQLFDPGSDLRQRQFAQQWDPYPDTNIGPAVTGARPDAYTAPMPEPVRGSENNRWAMTPFLR